jgi:serine/threonine-protein kinase
LNEPTSKTREERKPILALQPSVVIDDRLRIESYIGSGGMCDVYKATHLNLMRETAVKVLKPSLTNDPDRIKRFEREATLISALKHPNIVDIFAVGIVGNRPYIALEYLPGRSLAQLLDSAPNNRLDPKQAVAIFTQICDALAHAHSNGVVHRDIKPSNVMLLESDSVVKLTDFGIAKYFQESSQEIQKLTQTGELIGSIQYMSPEQCQALPVDGRSDLYSLGCLMYETLVGNTPFAAEAPLAVLVQHAEAQPPTSKELRTPLG